MAFQLIFVDKDNRHIRDTIDDVTQITLISRHEVRFKKGGQPNKVAFLPNEYLEVKKS